MPIFRETLPHQPERAYILSVSEISAEKDLRNLFPRHLSRTY